MPISAHNPYEEPDSSATARWVAIFVLLSLLAHAIIIAIILLITIFMPVPKIIVPVPASPTVSLSLVPPAPAPPRKPIFIPTTPDANAPHKEQPIESANDTELKSRSKVARAKSIMPDVIGKEHANDLNTSPSVQAPPTPQVSSTPPTPKQARPEKPTPPQPKAPVAKQNPAKPAKPTPPTPQTKPQPQLDANGLPVLPPLNIPTMAQVNPALASPPPTPVQPQQAGSVHGALGMQGANSPAAMATELGRYKQYLYSVVGSYWYPAVDKSFQVLPVGIVRIRFTLHSDGTLTDVVVLEGNQANLQLLMSISKNALVSPAPYKPFPPGMIKELIKEQGGDGSTYTDDFSFSVY
ncbi:MAG: hypothetical protein LV480_02420 [Methylacidiphilales bacterium]|nr:hypothetical protein [Candidatus Methylacidiphilales bacterium]